MTDNIDDMQAGDEIGVTPPADMPSLTADDVDALDTFTPGMSLRVVYREFNLAGEKIRAFYMGMTTMPSKKKDSDGNTKMIPTALFAYRGEGGQMQTFGNSGDSLVKQVRIIQPGTPVEITFIGTEETKNGFNVKVYDVVVLRRPNHPSAPMIQGGASATPKLTAPPPALDTPVYDPKKVSEALKYAVTFVQGGFKLDETKLGYAKPVYEAWKTAGVRAKAVLGGKQNDPLLVACRPASAKDLTLDFYEGATRKLTDFVGLWFNLRTKPFTPDEAETMDLASQPDDEVFPFAPFTYTQCLKAFGAKTLKEMSEGIRNDRKGVCGTYEAVRDAIILSVANTPPF